MEVLESAFDDVLFFQLVLFGTLNMLKQMRNFEFVNCFHLFVKSLFKKKKKMGRPLGGKSRPFVESWFESMKKLCIFGGFFFLVVVLHSFQNAFMENVDFFRIEGGIFKMLNFVENVKF